MAHQILITLDGGIIQGIEGIPPGVEIVVKDFDLSEFPEDNDETYIDDQGDECYLNFWYDEQKERALIEAKAFEEARKESTELYQKIWEGNESDSFNR